MFGRSIRRGAIGLVAACGLATLSLVAGPQAVAHADAHRVHLTEACKHQYGKQSAKLRHVDDVQQQKTTPGSPSADQIHNPQRATPFGYFCVDSVYTKDLGTGGINAHVSEQELGDLNVQQYCDWKYPGSKARGNYDSDKTWDCVR